MISQQKKDNIFNALCVGMALSDAYIFAGLTVAEIEEVSADERLQMFWNQQIRQVEYGLLKQMGEISQKQARTGREQATTWLLEHLYPRYSGKPMNEMPDIHLHLNNTDPASLDTVSINKGSPDDA